VTEVGPFPPEVKPVRSGVYRTSFGVREEFGYSYFATQTGRWSFQRKSPALAERDKNNTGHAYQKKRWSGLDEATYKEQNAAGESPLSRPATSRTLSPGTAIF